MFSNKLRIAGILLVTAHYCHSFVLLTANIEDVKKIARKFVSESMAQQIADFIQKAASQQGQMVKSPNVSEENERNVEKMDTFSDNDDAVRKAQRQGASSDRNPAFGYTSKRHRKPSRPATTSRHPGPFDEPRFQNGPSDSRDGPYSREKENRFPKKQQLELRQSNKKRWTPVQRDLNDQSEVEYKKQQAKEQLRQHQQLQQQLINMQSQVKEGTVGDALDKMNTNPKRLQKPQKQYKPQKPIEKKRISKPNSEQQQYELQPVTRQQNPYQQQNKYQENQYQENQYQENLYQPNQNQQNQYQQNEYQQSTNKLYSKKQQNPQRYRIQKPLYKNQNTPTQNRNEQYQDSRQEANQPERTIRQQEPRPTEELYEDPAEQSKYLRQQEQRNKGNNPLEQPADAYQNEPEIRDEPHQKHEDQKGAEQEEHTEAVLEEEQKEYETEQTEVSDTTTSNYDVEYQTPPRRRKTRSRPRGRFALQDNEETEPTMVIQFSSRNPEVDAAEMTTEKEKNEFDQYDLKVPALVATSGPITLKASDWPDDLPMVRAQRKGEAEADGPAIQVAPVPARPFDIENHNEKSTVVINLVANVEQNTEKPTETDATVFGDLGDLVNLI